MEKIGVERSRNAAKDADLVLLTVDASQGWTDSDRAIYQQVKDKSLILIINKADLASPKSVDYPAEIKHTVHTSAANHQGITDLETEILTLAHQGKIVAANSEVAVNQKTGISLDPSQSSFRTGTGNSYQ